MEAAAYREMSELEDEHWWFRGKRRLVTPLIREAVAGRTAPALLDVGCGTGGNLVHIASELPGARLVGLDLDADALRFSSERDLGARLLRGSGDRLPLRTGSIDCVVALDFIEHVDDDRGLLEEFHRVLRPGGQVVASVPAYPWLWSPHDDFLHHKRRYRQGELEARLRAAGFEVERRHGFNFLLLPAVAAVRLVKRRRRGSAEGEGGTDFFRLPGPFNRAMAAVFALEELCVSLLPIRFGVSFMVRARKAVGA